MNQLLREPLLHFVLLGALIFAINARREDGRPMEEGSAKIEVTAAVIERLRAVFTLLFPTAKQAPAAVQTSSK